MKIAAIAAVALLATAPASANTHTTLLKACVAKTEDAERLKCFDGVAKFMETLQNLVEPEKSHEPEKLVREWEIQEKRDPVDDSPFVLASQYADGHNGFSGAMLAIRCYRGKTDLIVKWQNHLPFSSAPGRQTHPVTLRLGDEPAKTETWHVSTNYTATLYPTWPGKILLQAAKTRRIVAHIETSRGPETAEFSTVGLDKAIKAVAAACKWPEGVAG